MRLRHEARRADRDAHAAGLVRRVHAPRVQHLIGKLRNAEYVLVRLRRQTEHEVELDTVPPALKGDLAGMEQVFLAHVFIDRVAQALRSGLGRERQAALAHLLQAAHDVHGEVVRAQRRQREAHAARLAVFQQPVAHLVERAVVAARERQERCLLITGIFERLDPLTDNRLRFARAHRTIDIPRLTETAAADAAAKQLHVHAVMHDLRARHNGVRRIITGVEILNDALGHARGGAVRRRQVVQRAVRVPMRDVKRRNQDALDP